MIKYSIPSGTPILVTRGVDYSSRHETSTTKSLVFGAYMNKTRNSYQFEARGWRMVVLAVFVRVFDEAEYEETEELDE